MNPKVAQTIYGLGTIASAIMGIALIWGGIDSGAVDAANQIIGGLGALLGGTAINGLATVRTTKQINTGQLGASPVEQVVNGLQTMAAMKTQAETDLARATSVAQDVLGVLPGGAALAADLAAAASALGVGNDRLRMTPPRS